MSFDRSKLPDPVAFYQERGLTLTGRGKWRTAACPFHGGSDSLRIDTTTGRFVCMACCGARGDMLDYEQATTGNDFPAACRALGAWVDDGKPIPIRRKPAPLPLRDALQLIAGEATLIAVLLGNFMNGAELTEADYRRALLAAGRITFLVGATA